MSNNSNLNFIKANPTGYVVGSQFNQLVDLVRSLAICDHPDYRVHRNLSGTTLHLNQPHALPPIITPPISTPPVLSPLQPYLDQSTNANPIISMTYGTYGGVVPTIDGTALNVNPVSNSITLGTSDQVVYMECDFTYHTTSGEITITDAEILSATNAAFLALASSASSGTGVLYQALFGVTITAPVGSGPYTIQAAPAVGGSQNFGICLSQPIGEGAPDGINGPWGV